MNANEMITNLTNEGRIFWAANPAIASLATTESCLCKERSTTSGAYLDSKGYTIS